MAEAEETCDSIEIAKRQTQERELRSLLTTPSGTEGGGDSTTSTMVGAHWLSVAFDESGDFLVVPWWRGIAIVSLSTGKVRMCTTLTCLLHCMSRTPRP